MKRTRTPLVFLVFGILFFLGACNNYGKKITVTGTKGEVYYKDGATENEAQKVGNFLKQDGFFGSEKAASVQIDKKADDYILRFVYDKNYYEKTPGLEEFFTNYGARMSKELFGGKKVDIELADKYFNDFKDIPFNETVTVPPVNSPEAGFDKNAYSHEAVGDVNFYWKGISDDQSRPIIDYVSQNGAFSGGTAEIYITKEGDRYVLKFPVKEEYRNDPGTIAQVEKVSREIRDHVFPNEPFSFKMTDGELNSIRSFDY